MKSNDDSDDKINMDDENYNECIICEDREEKNNEWWNRCTICEHV